MRLLLGFTLDLNRSPEHLCQVVDCPRTWWVVKGDPRGGTVKLCEHHYARAEIERLADQGYWRRLGAVVEAARAAIWEMDYPGADGEIDRAALAALEEKPAE